MPRLSPTPPNGEQATRLARELLATQAIIRSLAKRTGPVASLVYDAGVPISEIADAFRITDNAVYKLIERHPLDCHQPLAPGDACAACGTVEASV